MAMRIAGLENPALPLLRSRFVKKEINANG